VVTILQMVMLTRLDCMLGATAEMRMALAQALHHTRHRRTFGKPLVEHALMVNVLADLSLEWEAALALCLRVAGAVDRAPTTPHEAAFARIATAIGKYWICRRAPALINEAQECLGGAGYVEESILPRLFRQSPLNGIWEGSGNIQCLDVLRALAREPECGQALLDELAAARGLDRDYEQRFDAIVAQLAEGQTAEAGARLLVEHLALLLQASVLLRSGSPAAALFCRSRLGGQHGLAMGTLPARADFGMLISRALP
jgi:putative acyl-CoA dehydrogenase